MTLTLKIISPVPVYPTSYVRCFSCDPNESVIIETKWSSQDLLRHTTPIMSSEEQNLQRKQCQRKRKRINSH